MNSCAANQNELTIAAMAKVAMGCKRENETGALWTMQKVGGGGRAFSALHRNGGRRPLPRSAASSSAGSAGTRGSETHPGRRNPDLKQTQPPHSKPSQVNHYPLPVERMRFLIHSCQPCSSCVCEEI
jgi:hypothetical protein